MNIPLKVRFTASAETKEHYAFGLTQGNVYDTSFWDEGWVQEIYEEDGTITVIDDEGAGHEISYGDYEVIEENKLHKVILTGKKKN